MRSKSILGEGVKHHQHSFCRLQIVSALFCDFPCDLPNGAFSRQQQWCIAGDLIPKLHMAIQE